ncbi:hypothetical protein CDV36_008198 [Fusarium kuroshium]|uniref:Uncharacterized protein n=1 Tax=Fusarium kuroshium TaxID=2010991 RepID=A0A3M2S3N0_9HYPO|nr:hypothetical protein CDV36_008198 [Fusarium kuroshium]
MDPAKQTPPNPSLPLASHILIDSSSGIAHDWDLSSLLTVPLLATQSQLRGLMHTLPIILHLRMEGTTSMSSIANCDVQHPKGEGFSVR